MFIPKLTVCSLLCASAMLAGCALAPSSRDTGDGAYLPGLAPDALYRVGRQHQARFDYLRASAAYREALRQEPGLVEARNALGVMLSTQGRYNEAIVEFLAAIELAPDHAYLHNNLGYAELLRGAPQAARAALEIADRLEPGQARTERNLQAARRASPVAAPGVVTPTLPAAPSPLLPPAPGAVHTGVVEVAPQVFELQVEAKPVQAAPSDTIAATAASKAPARAVAAPASAFGLEVANGNGVTGMAKRVAAELRRLGIHTARLTNQRPFKQALTEIQYRGNYAAEAARLGQEMKSSSLVLNDQLPAGVHVKLVLGRDSLVEAGPLQALSMSTVQAQSASRAARRASNIL